MKFKQHILVCAIASALFFSNEVYSGDTEVITVTSQRTESSILDVSSNTSYFSADTLKQLNIESLQQLLTLVPNFTMQSITGDYDYVQVRGMPRNFEQSTITVFVDGVPYSSLYGLNLSLQNVASVELIRGPQGNLFGRNSRDGIIVINTKKPTNQWHGEQNISFAELGQHFANANLRGAIVDDSVWINVAGQYLKRDGTVRNTLLSTDVDPVSSYNIESSLSWLLNNFSGKFSLFHENKDTGLAPYVSESLNIQDGDPLNVALNIDNSFEQTTTNSSLQLNWQLDRWRLSSITSLADMKTDAEFDADYSALPYGSYLTSINEQDFYQEVRVTNTNSNASIKWLIGASYNRNKQNNGNDYPLMMMDTKAKLSRENHLVYIDFIWKINPKWQLQAGTRYFDEEVTVKTDYTNHAIPLPTINTTGKTKQQDARFLSKASLNYRIASQQTLFASYGEGYLSAGTSWLMERMSNLGIRQGTGLPYQHELSKNIELGYRAFFPATNTHLEIVAFSSEIEGYQHFHNTIYGIPTVTSVDLVESQGLEISLNTSIFESIQWQFSAGFHEAQVEAIATETVQDIDIRQGSQVPYTPKYSISNALIYQHQFDDNYHLTASLTWKHNAPTYLDFAKSTKQASSNIFNTAIDVNISDNWQIKLWANNLTDQRIKQFSIAMPGDQLINFITPRQIGLTLSHRF